VLPGDLCGRVVKRLFPMWLPIDAAPRTRCSGAMGGSRSRIDRAGPDWGWWSRPSMMGRTDPDADRSDRRQPSWQKCTLIGINALRPVSESCQASASAA